MISIVAPLWGAWGGHTRPGDALVPRFSPGYAVWPRWGRLAPKVAL